MFPFKTPLPLQLSSDQSLKLWFDFANFGNISQVSNAVSKVIDQSGNGNDATQDTAGNKPTYVSDTINGLGVISLTTNDFLSFDGSDFVGTNLTIFSVTQRTDTVSIQNPIIGGQTRSTGNNLVFFYSSDTAFSVDTFGSGVVYTVPAYSSPIPKLHSAICSSTNGKKIWENGALKVSDGTKTQNLSAFAGASIGRFKTETAQAYFEGDVGEVLIFTKELTDSERQAVEGYLADKWGIYAEGISTWQNKFSVPIQVAIAENGLSRDQVLAGEGLAFGQDFTNTSNMTIGTGNKVSAAIDQGFNEYNISNATESAQPVYTADLQNDLGGLVFDGADDFLSFGVGVDFSDLSTQEFFCVAKADDTAAIKVLFSQWASTKSYAIRYLQNETMQLLMNNATDGVIVATTSDAKADVAAITDYYITPTEGGVAFNGASFATVAASEAVVTPNASSPRIGHRSDGAEEFKGAIFECWLFPSKLSTTGRTTMLNYLSNKYNITLS